MKLKNLKKKIRRLEKRLREGPTKLAKLKQKLEAAATTGAAKKKKKSAARAGRAGNTVKASERIQRDERRLAPIARTQPAAVESPSGAKKVKRKLNLTPERRAQLAAAMNARWAAKRAAEANPKTASIDQDSTMERTPQTPESRHEGV